MNKRSVFFLQYFALAFRLRGAQGRCAALEFGGTEGDRFRARLYFDGDSPVFLENGFTDLCDLYVTGAV